MAATVTPLRTRGVPTVPRIPDGTARRVIGRYVGEERLTAQLRDCVSRVLRIVAAEPLLVSPQLVELAGGGKRLRPLFVLAAAHSAPTPPGDRAIRAAVVVELLHLASLLHDDVMDEAATRHGVTTVNTREGNIRAVLVGDYLLAQALSSAGTLGRSEAVIASRTFVRLCEGQAYESASLFNVNRTQESYFRAIAAKTGALVEASCRLGALSGGLELRPAAALAEYGMSLGIALQLLDDVLDFTATAEQLGKPAGHDVFEGVYTLPLLWTLRRQPKLARVLADPDRHAAAAEAVELVRASGGIDATLAEAREHAARAVNALSSAAPWITADATDMLAALADSLVPTDGGTAASALRPAA